MGFILDTNVASEVTRRSPNTNVKAWLDTVPGPALHLSVMVIGEIRQGVERLRQRDPKQASVYETWLARLRSEFHDRIVPITVDIAQEWGRLNAQRPLPVVDGILAATASANGWVLVTRNVKDFNGVPVHTLNPFEPLT